MQKDTLSVDKIYPIFFFKEQHEIIIIKCDAFNECIFVCWAIHTREPFNANQRLINWTIAAHPLVRKTISKLYKTTHLDLPKQTLHEITWKEALSEADHRLDVLPQAFDLNCIPAHATEFSPALILRAIKAVKQTDTTKPWQDINHEIRKFMLESSVDKQDLEKMSIEEVKSCYENNAWVAQCEIPSEDHLSPEAQAALNAGGSMLLPEFSRTTLSQRRFSI